MSRGAAIIWGPLFLYVSSVAGCTLNEKVRVSDGGAPVYDRLNVVYDVPVDIGPLNQPQTVHQASHAANGDGEHLRSRVRLTIEYPHRDAHPEFARATLQVMSGDSASASGHDEPIEEQLILDLPKTELDGLLYDLARGGYFDRRASGTGGARIELTYNQARVEKAWSREPRLDDIVTTLERHGTPIGVEPTKERSSRNVMGRGGRARQQPSRSPA